MIPEEKGHKKQKDHLEGMLTVLFNSPKGKAAEIIVKCALICSHQQNAAVSLFLLFTDNQHPTWICTFLNHSEFISSKSIKNKSWYDKSKVGDSSQGWPEGSLFNNNYTKV